MLVWRNKKRDVSLGRLLIQNRIAVLGLKSAANLKSFYQVKLMNRRQQERIVEIQAELKRRQEADERSKREALGRKLNKAAENHAKKV